MDGGETVSLDGEAPANSVRLTSSSHGPTSASGLQQDSPSDTDQQSALQWKVSHGLLIAFVTWVFILHAFGIYIFTNGFLLTRLVLSEKSECAIPPADIVKSVPKGLDQQGCWHPKTFEKAVVVIIDALRYDFTVPYRSMEGNHYFHNAFPTPYRVALEQPNNAFLLPFIADPPTTTLVRLKALTTGTLPTFIDAGSNFAGTAIEEDNLLSQLKSLGKRLVHLGDDTWQSLFPEYFEPNLTKPFDSFNVWDLHTVDNGVTEHIFPLLHASNTSQWDVIFAHYLGVDHAGHRYGPDHPAMKAKLKEMDTVVQRLMDAVDDDTLLVVMGDHGMDSKGDHGGESREEVQAALWMYCKKGVFGRSSPSRAAPPQSPEIRSVSQIDLVPTLALLLGLPIPFNNLGAPIEEAFIGREGQNWYNLLNVMRLTASQIHRYQQAYLNARKPGETVQSDSLNLWTSAEKAWQLLERTKNPVTIHVKDVLGAFTQYQSETLSLCRSLWTSFDVGKMATGILILSSSLIILIVYTLGMRGDQARFSPNLLRGSAGALAGALLGLAVSFMVPSISSLASFMVGTSTGSIIGIMHAIWSLRSLLVSPLPTSAWGWTCFIVTILLSAGFASNSFTIWEDEILLYFLCTIGIMFLISSLRRTNLTERTLGGYHSILFMVLTRIASMSRLCREEQIPYCKSTYYASTTSSTSSIWQLTIPFLSALLLPALIRSYYHGTRSYQGSAKLWLDYAFQTGLFLAALFWVLDSADDGEWFGDITKVLKSIRVILAQFILALAFPVGYSIFIWAGPFIKIEKLSASQPPKNSRPRPADTDNPTDSAVAILGYANVHGSRYMILMTMWLLAIALVQKPMGSGAIAACAWQIFSLLELLDINSLSDTSVGPVALGIMGSFYFFKTGHQATLSTIQWDSAFIAMKTVQNPWSALLVVLNEFGAQILCTLAVPGIALWKKPPKQKGLLGAVAKSIATHMLFYAVINLATTIWAGHLRRHLMLYRIFNPRFMTGAAVLLIVDVVSIIFALGGVRWSFTNVAGVFGWPL